MSEVEMVLVPKAEYDSLREAADFLDALQSAGVDNWEGYSMAYQILAGEDV